MLPFFFRSGFVSVMMTTGVFVQRTSPGLPPSGMNVCPFGFNAWHCFGSGGVSFVLWDMGQDGLYLNGLAYPSSEHNCGSSEIFRKVVGFPSSRQSHATSRAPCE